MKTIIIAALMFAYTAQPAYRVIVDPENPASTIEQRTLAAMFLKKTTTWSDGTHVVPVDLAAGSDTRVKFTESVLNKSISAVKSYWQQLIFSGRGLPPPELDSDEAVVRYVITHRGAIGYVSEKAQIGAAKELAVH